MATTKNWVRLALIPAGGDWRDLPAAVALPGRDARQNGGFGVEGWSDAAHAVIAEGTVRNTHASVADPRLAESADRHDGKYGVEDWQGAAHTVIGEARTGKAWAGVADPRLSPTGDPTTDRGARHKGKLGVEGWAEPCHTIIANAEPQLGRGAVVADPRLGCTPHVGTMGVLGAADPAGTILATADVHNAGVAYADPRLPKERREGSIGVTERVGGTGQCTREDTSRNGLQSGRANNRHTPVDSVLTQSKAVGIVHSSAARSGRQGERQ